MQTAKKQSKSLDMILITLGTLFLIIALSFPPVDALSESYSEDFTSTTFMDMEVTNATGWGSGNINSPKMNPVIVGTCDTPDAARDVFVRDNYAYVASRTGEMKAIDIRDKSAPFISGGYIWADLAWEVFVDGEYAYVIDSVGVGSYDYVRVANLTDPAHPTTIPYASYSHFSSMQGLYVSGNHLYVATGLYGLDIINATEPTHLHQLGICDTPGDARDVVVTGNYAYVADGSGGLQVINVTDPTNPTIIGSYNTPSNAVCLSISGNFAYIADYASGVQIINVTDPTNPTLTSVIDTPDASYGVEVVGDLVYIADRYSGLQVANVSDPTNPVIVGACDTPSMAEDVAVLGNYAYVADGASGLQIIQIGDIAPLRPVGSCEAPNLSFSVSVDGDYAYIGSPFLTVLNVSNPSTPTTLGSFYTGGECLDLNVEGDLVYTVNGYGNEFFVINVSDPLNPTYEGSWTTPDSAYGLDLEGNIAYIAAGTGGLQVVDITDPSTPTFVSECVVPGFEALGVVVSGNKAYMSGYDGWVQKIDVTNPHHPSLLESYNYSLPMGNPALDLWVLDDCVCVGDYSFGLQIISIEDPTQMMSIGNYSFTDIVYDIWVEGDLVYIAEQSVGLHVLDISNRTNPVLIESISIDSTAVGVHVVGDHAFVACFENFEVIEVNHNRVRQYEEFAVAGSLPVIDIPGEWSEILATLTVSSDLPSGTSITYYLSADNGTHWESVTPGVPHGFSYLGESIRWKAELSTTDRLYTSRIYELNINLTSVLEAPSLMSPGDNVFINDTTPTLEWSPISGAVDYLLQIDNTSAFNSDELVNVTIYGATSHTFVVPLAENTWYWRVLCFDADDDEGVFSGSWSFTLDITPPGSPTLVGPESDTLTSNNAPTFSWNHATDWHHYIIQFDTVTTFDSGNLRTSPGVGVAFYTPVPPLTDGLWYWRVCAVDVAGNYGSYTPYWNITIDTTGPVWNTPVTDQIAEFAQSFRYDCSASDPSGIFGYSINDTAQFGIFGNGTVYNNIYLPVGEYWLEVSVVDIIYHVVNATFKVTVSDTLGPIWDEMVEDVELPFGVELDLSWFATDPSGVDHYAVSDTTHFSIDSTGRIVNITTLDSGTYELTMYAYDIYNNVGEVTITVTVLEATTTTTTTTTTTIPPDYTVLMIAIGGGAVIVVIILIFVLKSRKGT